MGSAVLINSELKCLDRWLKLNKISINADKTKYMLFSYNKNVNFSDTSVGNNTIKDTSVTKFLGIHLNKKLNFLNHITEMSMKVAKSMGLSYKLNRFLPETSLKTLYTSLFHPYLSYGKSKRKHCVLHNGMKTWNSLPDIFKVSVSFSMFKSKV